MGRLVCTRGLRALGYGLLDFCWPTRCPICDTEILMGEREVLLQRRGTGRALVHRRCIRGLPHRRSIRLSWGRWAEGVPAQWVFDDGPGVFAVLHRAKYGAEWPLLSALCRVTMLALERVDVGSGGTIVVPLPDDACRRRQRGYSITVHIARAISRRPHHELRTDLLRRRRHAPAQAGLTDPASRRRNVCDLFAVGLLDQIHDDRRLLLVDDQITTGATLAEALRLLGGRGHRLSVLALAGARRAPRRVGP